MPMLLIAAAALATSAPPTRDQPIYAPPLAWVKAVPIPFDMKASGAAADVLLLNEQTRLSPGDDETFIERAIRINQSQGLGAVGNLIEAWNPRTDTLTIHRAAIIRNGKTIDLLANGRRFTVLRRETNLEAAVIDGELTATLQPEGLQVGDVLTIAVTLVRREPALAGHSQGVLAVRHAGVIGRLVVKASWPAGAAFQTWKSDDLPALVVDKHGDWIEAGFEQRDAVTPDPPAGAPSYEQLAGLVEAGDFKDWAAVSATTYPLYAKAELPAPASPLRAEIARLKAATPDPKARALAALELVESQVRYLYLGLDAGGYTPAPADVTWGRRFGDCKAKTVLLLSLLHGLGIEAEAALVSTALGDGFDRALPLLGAFDHVIVRATINGRVYWLDGTRQGDESLDVLPVPNYHWALPLRAADAKLEALAPETPALPFSDLSLFVDAKAGIDKPAKVHEVVVVRGDAGLFFNLAIKQASREDADRRLRQALTAQNGWITPTKVDYAYDPQRMEFRATLDGSGVLPLTSNGGALGAPRDWLIATSSVGADVDLRRTSDYHKDAPYAVAYPAFGRASTEVLLPDDGKGFATNNGGVVARVVSGVAYHRAAGIVNGRMVVIASAQAVSSRFPAKDAAAAEAEMRNLSEYPVSLRYTPEAQKPDVASKKTPDPDKAPGPDPATAARDAFLAKHYDVADADFTALIAKAPTAKLYYDRAATRLGLGNVSAAKADLDAALKLDPNHAYALFGLGRLALAEGDLSTAEARFKAAYAASGTPGNMAMMIARLYERDQRWLEASRFFDLASDVAAGDEEKAFDLNLACWNRAEAGRELERALSQCDHSLALRPKVASVLDSRGLVQLRLGALDKALADYDAALAIRPQQASSLFGRSLVKARLKLVTESRADAAAALAEDANIEKTFAGYGLAR